MLLQYGQLRRINSTEFRNLILNARNGNQKSDLMYLIMPSEVDSDIVVPSRTIGVNGDPTAVPIVGDIGAVDTLGTIVLITKEGLVGFISVTFSDSIFI